MIRAIASTFSISVLATLAASGCTDDYSTVTQESHSWGGYHWARTSNPFTLDVGDNVSSQWDSILNTTVSDWSKSTVVDLNKVGGGATGKRCRGSAGRVEVCNSAYGNNGWLGVASISISGKHITQGTVKLNDTYFNTARYNTTAWRNLVSCQEVGHTLGLDHQDEDFGNANLNTCMDYASDPTSNQHPNTHDYDMLKTIYQHLDTTTTVGADLPTGAGDSAAEWGLLVASSNNGMQEVFVSNHAHGQVFTFVIWAEE
jgi:hypothetical protein